MTATELAAMLNGVSYGREVSELAQRIAEESGLVIIYGASDDLMEIDGAIRDEADVWNGGLVRIDRNGVHRFPDSDCDGQNCPYFRESLTRCISVQAVWYGRNEAAAWTYETSVPHAEFKIFEDNELWCVGIVFSINDIPE